MRITNNDEYTQQVQLQADQERARRKLLGQLVETTQGEWEAEGEVAVGSPGIYVHVYGHFGLDNPKRQLSFNGDGVGAILGAGNSRGKVTFAVPLEEVLAGSLLFNVVTGSIIAGYCVVDFSRNFKHIGTFVGAGFGVASGYAAGSCEFKLS